MAASLVPVATKLHLNPIASQRSLNKTFHVAMVPLMLVCVMSTAGQPIYNNHDSEQV